MLFKIFKFGILFITVIFTAFSIFLILRQPLFYEKNNFSDLTISTSTPHFPPAGDLPNGEKTFGNVATSSESAIKIVKPKLIFNAVTAPIIKNQVSEKLSAKEISDKDFEILINSSVIQLYCGNFNSEEMSFSDISRGTGIIIGSDGKILTNRHVIYDENLKKNKNNCFVLKSPFPNISSQVPKIYYTAEIINYPLTEKFSDSFSKDKYYNDFALLKIVSPVNKESKINLLLGFNYAAPSDYSVLENNGAFNFLPIDWSYQPKNDDILITLGYGVDASHLANQITSTTGKIAGNIDIDKTLKPQILLVESNATAGFSGGALINPRSKGLIGLVSWITSGDITGKYTVAIFRDFLRTLMLQDLNLDLK